MGSSGETNVHVHVCALLYLLVELNGVVVVVVVVVSCNKGCYWHMCKKNFFSTASKWDKV